MFAGDSVPITLASSSRAFLAGIFAMSGTGKLFSISKFEETLRSYEIIPPRLVKSSALTITGVEFLIATFLVLGFCVQLAAACSSLLFALFSAAMAVNLMRGRNWLDCGCFGSLGTRIHWNLVVRNLLVAATTCVPLLCGGWITVGERLRLDSSLFCGLVALVLFALATLLLELSSMRLFLREGAK